MDLSGAVWRKSIRSGDDGGECVEVALSLPGSVGVRDSKSTGGAVILCRRPEWVLFVCAVRDEALKG
ncbi:hypothetical protein GCM10009677_32140 [Sphaerisporangium rubeum]|uniref:DUF397 domain-containing protein n=1 Tax=Sphaerisporangium rubeum TaxID=321317 RepID=A0A7X0ICJ8_9ACTN|nr:DUF397 domain-containing protein [Sphaerisporangium rubeum]MBB6472508.1 hypothetical protein [Sphaerisporangium rubeum]